MGRKQYRVCWSRPGTAMHYRNFSHLDAVQKVVERLLRNDEHTTVRVDMREVGEWQPWSKSDSLVSLYQERLSKPSG